MQHKIGALMIRIGFGVYYAIIIIMNPQHPILIIKAPTLEGSAVPFATSQSRILCFALSIQHGSTPESLEAFTVKTPKHITITETVYLPEACEPYTTWV